MNKMMIAKELIGIAKMLMGAVKDLAGLKALIPETRKKQQEYAEMADQMQRERNQMWADATRELQTGTEELLVAIKDELSNYFKQSGKGVRKADVSGTLVEVFLGGDDGVKRYQSKVSCQIVLTFEGSEKAVYMIRSENIDDDIQGSLSDKGTITKLIQEVKKADKDDFWDEPDVE